MDKTSDAVVSSPDERLHSVEAKLVKDGNITSFEYSISTFGHEIAHTTKRNYEIHKSIEDGTWDYEEKKYDNETLPTRVGRQILKEIGDNK